MTESGQSFPREVAADYHVAQPLPRDRNHVRVPVFRDALRDFSRLGQIATVVARHGFGEFLARTRVGETVGAEVDTGVPPEVRSKATAARFRDMLADLGPTYVKLGQVLSTRPDLLPAEWVDELRTLQDQAPAISHLEIRSQIADSLGQPVDELFSWIEETPLASASIAQVHRARTKEGELVVVKVQRPGIEETIRADLAILIYAAQLLEALDEEMGLTGPVGIIEEFQRSLLEELDFLHEAMNIRTFRERTEGQANLYVPRLYDSLSGRRVLTLEYLEGKKITDVGPERDPAGLAHKLIESGFRLLFEEGIFHGDPHPGNLLVLPDGRIGVLDFGLVGRLTPQMQENIVLLVLALAVRDADSLARLICRVGIPDARTNLASFRRDIDAILERYLGRSLKDVASRDVMSELLDLAVRYRIRIPKEYAILSKAVMTTEGIVRKLDPEMDLLAFGMPYAKGLLSDRFDPQSVLSGGLGLKSLLRLSTVLQDVPTQLSQVLLDLEGGRFTVHGRSPELKTLDRTIRTLGVTLFLAILASGFVVGSLVALSQVEGQLWGVLPLPALVGIIGLSISGLLFWSAISFGAVQGRIRRVPIARWIRRIAGGDRK